MISFDPNEIALAVTAAASAVVHISATEVVKEATKDAYKGLKSKIGEICGRGGQRAVEKVEAEPASAEASDNLKTVIANVPPEDEAEVLESFRALASALKNDEAARKTAETVASIKLDFDSGGHIRIHSLRNARTIDVKARAVEDIDFSNVDMDPGTSKGN